MLRLWYTSRPPIPLFHYYNNVLFLLWSSLKFYKKHFTLHEILAATTGFITQWTSKNQILLLKWICISCQNDWGWQKVDEQVTEYHWPISTIWRAKGEFNYFIKFQVPLIHSRQIPLLHWMNRIYSNNHSSVINAPTLFMRKMWPNVIQTGFQVPKFQQLQHYCHMNLIFRTHELHLLE